MAAPTPAAGDRGRRADRDRGRGRLGLPTTGWIGFGAGERLSGGAGDDTLVGGGSNDTLDGGRAPTRSFRALAGVGLSLVSGGFAEARRATSSAGSVVVG